MMKSRRDAPMPSDEAGARSGPSFLRGCKAPNALLLALVLSWPFPALAATEQSQNVENLVMESSGGGVVVIQYDLVSNDPLAIFSVRLLASTDGGQTYDIVATAITGDFGPDVPAGRSKRIVWDANRDVEQLVDALLSADLLRVRIEAIPRDVPVRRPTYWGLKFGFSPHWLVPQTFERMQQFRPIEMDIVGHDFRVGFVKGAPFGREWGVSVMRKTLRGGSSRTTMEFAPVPVPNCFDQTLPPCEHILRLATVADMSAWAAEAHFLAPVFRAADQLQLGVNFAGGYGKSFRGDLVGEVEGPIVDGDPFQSPPPNIIAQGPGFIGNPFHNPSLLEVAPGATTATLSLPNSGEEFFLLEYSLIVRVGVAADILLGDAAKLRVTTGFNYPGYEIVGFDFVYLFGAPDR